MFSLSLSVRSVSQIGQMVTVAQINFTIKREMKMARFRGTVQGSRGEASRRGGKSSGLRVECNGWKAGVTVQAVVGDDGRDMFVLRSNGGSNGSGITSLIGYVAADGTFVSAEK